MRWVDQSGDEWHLLLRTLIADEQRQSQLDVSDTLSTLDAVWVEEPTVVS